MAEYFDMGEDPAAGMDDMFGNPLMEENVDTDAVRRLSLSARQIALVLNTTNTSIEHVPAIEAFLKVSTDVLRAQNLMRALTQVIAVSRTKDFNATVEEIRDAQNFSIPVLRRSLTAADAKVSVIPVSWVLPMITEKRPSVVIDKTGLVSKNNGGIKFVGEGLPDDVEAITKVLGPSRGKEPSIMVISDSLLVTRLYKIFFVLLHDRAAPGTSVALPKTIGQAANLGVLAIHHQLSRYMKLVDSRILPAVNDALSKRAGSFDICLYRATEAFVAPMTEKERDAVKAGLDKCLTMQVSNTPIVKGKLTMNAATVKGICDTYTQLLDMERKVCGMGDPATNPTKGGLPFGAAHLPNRIIMRECMKRIGTGSIHVFGIKTDNLKSIFPPGARGESVEIGKLEIHKIRQVKANIVVLYFTGLFDNESNCESIMKLQHDNPSTKYFVVDQFTTDRQMINCASMAKDISKVAREHTTHVMVSVIPSSMDKVANGKANLPKLLQVAILASASLEERVQAALSGVDKKDIRYAPVGYEWTKVDTEDAAEELNIDDLTEAVSKGEAFDPTDFMKERGYNGVPEDSGSNPNDGDEEMPDASHSEKRKKTDD